MGVCDPSCLTCSSFYDPGSCLSCPVGSILRVDSTCGLGCLAGSVVRTDASCGLVCYEDEVVDPEDPQKCKFCGVNEFISGGVCVCKNGYHFNKVSSGCSKDGKAEIEIKELSTYGKNEKEF